MIKRGRLPHGLPRGARLGLVLALLGSCVALLLGLWFWNGVRALAGAQARWERQQPTHYRLAITYHDFVSCRQEVEVAQEQVITVLANDCARPVRTVEALFGLVQEYEERYGGLCGPNGCACDGPIGVAVDYDRELGYPRTVEVRPNPGRRWRYLDYWRPMHPCTLMGFYGARFEATVLPVP